MVQYEKRFTISESKEENIIETLDSIRGHIGRSEAIKKIIAYIIQDPQVCKSILETQPTINPSLTPQDPPILQ